MKRQINRQKLAERIRIQAAVVGFQIPMLSIPNLYRTLELAIEAGKSNEELKALVKAFPGVEVSR